MLLDQPSETGDLAFAEKQQVFGLAVVLELKAGSRQCRLDLALRFGRVTVGQALQQQLLELLGTYAAMLGGDEVVLLGRQADRTLEALAAHPCPAMATENGVLGSTGVVAVEVGRGEVLDQVEFDEQTHDIPLNR
ncbi:hypothetical protein D9M69_513330 [compost metagenome]